MAILAIQGHATRGRDVIGLLEMLGGKNVHRHIGTNDRMCYCIRDAKIECHFYQVLNTDVYYAFTLEQFLEKFPYKVGDKVTHQGGKLDYTISRMKWVGDEVEYFINYDEYNGLDAYACDLQLYTGQEETMESTIKWQTGKPTDRGRYVVTVKGLGVTTAAFIPGDSHDEHFFKEYVSAWFKLSDIKPYKEE